MPASRERRVDKTELSSREKQIFELATEGLSDKSIAGRLGISPATVKSYWVRIRQKVGSYNRAETIAKKLHSDHRETRPIQQWLQALCLYAPWSFLVLDDDGRVCFVSRAAEHHVSNEVIGRRLLDLCPPADQARLGLALERVRQGSSIDVHLALPESYCGGVPDQCRRMAPITTGGAVTGVLCFLDRPTL